MEQKFAYRAYHLQQIGNTIGKLAKESPDFRKYVHSEVRQLRTGDYEVLIKTLLGHPEFGSKLQTKELLAGYEAFQELEGENWEPQISIPRFEYLDDQSRNQPLSSDLEFIPEPYFVITDGNEDVPALPGYILNDSGFLEQVSGLLIDSAFAQIYEVWVLSLNENVVYGTYEYETNWNQSTPPPAWPPVNTGSVTTAFIQNMTIRHRKESYFFNRDDVHILRMSSWYHPESLNPITNQFERWNSFTKGVKKKVYTESGQQATVCKLNGHGTLIRKFTTREINNRTSINVNFDYFKDWSGNGRSRQQASYGNDCRARYNEISGNILYYVIFEFDAWPAPLRTVRIFNPSPLSGQEFEFSYRCWQSSPYSSGYVRHSAIGQSGIENNFRTLDFVSPSINFTSRAR
ncbi:MAG: hypothetical protein ACK4E8_04000 [Lacibacter sp.]